MNLFIRLIILIFAVFVASKIIPGVSVNDFTTLVVVSVVIGIVNTFLKPILVILTLPLTIVTLGIFFLVLNGLLVLLVREIVPGFYVSGLVPAILFSIVVSLVSSFLSTISGE